MMRTKADRKAHATDASVDSLEGGQPVYVSVISVKSESSKRSPLAGTNANGFVQNGKLPNGKIPNGHEANGEPTDGSSSSNNSSDEGENVSAPTALPKAAKASRSRSSWGLRRSKKADAEGSAGADAVATEAGTKSLTEGSSRRKGNGMRNMLRALKLPSGPSPFEGCAVIDEPASRTGSLLEDKRKGAKGSRSAPTDQARLEEAMSGHHSFTAEGSLSSVTTSRAQSFEAGDPNEGPPEGQPGAKGLPADKRGHSRSRSWVAAAIAPFSRSASGVLKPSEEGENGKAEKASHTPRGSLDAALPSPPPTPEQPKPAASAISCLNIFPVAKGSASDGEYEVVEPSKTSSLKHPLPLPPLKNIGNTCFMNANLQMLLHAPPVQAVLRNMPVSPPSSEGPPTPRVGEALRSGEPSDPPSAPGSASGDQSADPNNEGSRAQPSAQAAPDGPQTDPKPEVQHPSGGTDNGTMDADCAVAAQAPAAEAAAAEDAALLRCSPGSEKVSLPPIEEHASAEEPSPGPEPTQLPVPSILSEKTSANPSAEMYIRTSAEDAASGGDADSESSSRSQTPVFMAGVATPDIAHPPSAVESLQRGHQPWAAARPAAVLQAAAAISDASSAGPASSAAPAPSAEDAAAGTGLSETEPAGGETMLAEQALYIDPGHCCADRAAEAEKASKIEDKAVGKNASESEEKAAVEKTGGEKASEGEEEASESRNKASEAEAPESGDKASEEKAAEAEASEGKEKAASALPPLAAVPELKPGELFRAFRCFAHETLNAPSDEPANPEALVKTFFRTEIGMPFSNGGQHDTEESLREFMRALEADLTACHSREDECLVGESCLCNVRKPAQPAAPAGTSAAPPAPVEPVLSPAAQPKPAEPVQAAAAQPSTALPRGKSKDAKKAEQEADKKAKEGAKKGKEDAKRSKEDAKKGKEDAKKGEDATEKKGKEARKEATEEALCKEVAKGEARWAQDTRSKLPFEMLFTGQEQSSSTCPKCGSMSTMYDVSTMLTLSLTKKQEGWWAAMLARKAPLTLQDCLQGYTQEETLPADDYVMCDDCKEKTKDRKALKLHRLPEVLLIMLKRTMYPSTEKDDRHITFPLEGLDFAPYMSEASALEGAGPCTYDLAGVCAHDGKSVNCGHYRAVCRRPASSIEEQDAWYMYDDDKPAQLLKPEQVSSQIAYVLCYCRSRKGAAGERPKSIDTPV